MSNSLKIAFVILGILCIIFFRLLSYAVLKASIFHAAQTHNFMFVKAAVNKSPRFVNLNYKGWSLLHEAAENSDEKITEFLIHCGADVNIVNYDNPTIYYKKLSDCGKTPLHIAVIYDIMIKYDNRKIVELLLSGGANINAKDNEGKTPLHYAAIHDKVGMVKLLLNNGAEVNARDNKGATPIHLCRNAEIARLLVSRGAEY